MPLSRVSEEILGEIYKKRIYISKHCEEHFKTLSAKFDFIDNEMDITIFNKIEEYFDKNYNRFGWMWPISKDDQVRLGICFTVQMHNKGTFILFIKKNFKDVETFLEHYYHVFDFLEYEEHGRLLNLFRIQKEDRKLFDYIHLVNKIGPKKTIDKDFKGSHIKVEYFTLQSGKKAINVKIDYSDPHEPELEFEGPEAQTKNFRDILIKPAETLPTLDNIGKWSLDARNYSKDLKFQNQKIIDELNSSGQSLQLVQKEVNELNGQIFGLDIKTDLYQVETKEAIKIVLQGIEGTLEGIKNHTILLDKTTGDLRDCFRDDISGFENEVSMGFSKIDEKLETIHEKIDTNYAELKELITEEFKNIKFRIKNALYLILRKLDNGPGITIKKLQEEVGIPRTTLLHYLKKLQEKKFIDIECKKTGKPGRPPKIFKSTKKLKLILKNKNEE